MNHKRKHFLIKETHVKRNENNILLTIFPTEMAECFERPHHIQHSLYASGSDGVGRGGDFTAGVPTRHPQSKHIA